MTRTPALLRRTATVALVLLAGSLIAVPALAVGAEHAPNPAGWSAAHSTAHHRVDPLGPEGRLRAAYDVARTVRGDCWTASFENQRLYRCMTAHHYIHDPCWVERSGTSVVCPLVPWSRSVVRMRLTGELPAPGPSAAALWGLRLGDRLGVRCIAGQGAGDLVDGKPVSYLCGHGWVVLGTPDRRTTPWTVATARWRDGHYRTGGRKQVTDAWLPVP